MDKIVEILKSFVKYYPSFKQVFPPSIRTIPNEKVYDTLFYLTNTLPLDMMEKAAELPYYGNEKKRD